MFGDTVEHVFLKNLIFFYIFKLFKYTDFKK